MGRAYEFGYCHTSQGSHGTMECTVCRKPITEGEYRVFKKNKDGDWGYHTQHRACSADDPQWDKFDARREAREDHRRQFELEARAFVKRWGETDLSEFEQ